MVTNRRGKVSASRYKDTSRRVRTGVIGTHVSHAPVVKGAARNRANADSVEFSNMSRAKRAKRGYVDQILPDSQTRETESAYARRRSQRSMTEDYQRMSRRRAIVIALAAVLLVVVVASCVAVGAYYGSVSKAMGLEDSNAADSLVAVEDGEALYTLLIGEFTKAGEEYTGPDMLMLVRFDESTQTLCLISIPTNVQVSLNDGEVHCLRDAWALGGDAYVVSAVASLVGVDISHVVKTDGDGLVALVDELGGITVDLTEEIDDPNAGDVYLAAGEQTLNGEAALEVCRALNFADGDERRAENQQKVLLALAEKMLAAEGFSTIKQLDSLAPCVQTDLGARSAMKLLKSLKNIDLASSYAVRLPGYSTTSTATGIEYFIVSDDDWEAMFEVLEEGGDPASALDVAASADPSSFEIIVRNGSGLTGGATAMAELLSEGGFEVIDTGNAEQYVYTETLVVYQDDEFEEAAETVVAYLGVGRAIASNGYYSFSSDVLVILGGDWQPVS